MLHVADATEDDLYEAMDWLVERQGRIEKKLAARHLDQDGFALYDLTSSYFEGHHCPLAAYGHNRDKKKGKLQVNYGLLTNRQGIPVSVSVFEGNSGDPKTLMPQVEKIRDQFGIKRFVLVGDRGMLTAKQVDQVRKIDGVDWIGALRPEAIRKLVEGENFQMGLFDKRNLFEMTHPDFPGERLVACHSEELAKRRAAKRQDLIDTTSQQLAKIRRSVERGRTRGKDKIGLRVGKVINKYKVGKHFTLDIKDDAFQFAVNTEKVAQEAALDGIYVVRTSLPAKTMDAAETVRSYKLLSHVEQAFRSFKTVDLLVRPINHRLPNRVRAHIFICMLAYYVLWHMKEAWRPMLLADEDLDAKATRDPVAPAQRSQAATKKTRSKYLYDGTPVHSFQTLLAHMATIVRNTCQYVNADPQTPTFSLYTTPDEVQRKALKLLRRITL